MRIFLISILAGAMLVISGCAMTAQSSPAEQSASQEEALQTPQDADSINVEETARNRRPGENGNMNVKIGKIVSISDKEIIVVLADMQRPERNAPDVSAPSRQRGESQDERKRPEGSMPSGDDSSAQGERKMPEDGFPNGGRGFGGQMELTYSDEQTTYILAEGVKITKGMGDKSEAIAVNDLAKDDVVQLELNEKGEPISIRLWDIMPNAGSESSTAQG